MGQGFLGGYCGDEGVEIGEEQLVRGGQAATLNLTLSKEPDIS